MNRRPQAMNFPYMDITPTRNGVNSSRPSIPIQYSLLPYYRQILSRKMHAYQVTQMATKTPKTTIVISHTSVLSKKYSQVRIAGYRIADYLN